MFKDKDKHKMHYTKVYLYAQFDRLTGSLKYCHYAPCDSQAILNLIHSTSIPLTQSDLLRLGELETMLPPIQPDDKDISLDFKDVLEFTWYKKPVKVDWSCVTLPESPADALAPLGLSAEETAQIVREQQDKLNVTRS